MADIEPSRHVLVVCLLEWFEDQYKPDIIAIDEDIKKRYFGLHPDRYSLLAEPISNLTCVRALKVRIAEAEMGNLTTIEKIVDYIYSAAKAQAKARKTVSKAKAQAKARKSVSKSARTTASSKSK